jgi:hypothetical protein
VRRRRLLGSYAASPGRYCFHKFLYGGRRHEQKLRLRSLGLLDDGKLLSLPVVGRALAFGREVQGG